MGGESFGRNDGRGRLFRGAKRRGRSVPALGDEGFCHYGKLLGKWPKIDGWLSDEPNNGRVGENGVGWVARAGRRTGPSAGAQLGVGDTR